FRNWQAYMQ
nr:Chain A, zinc finger protein 292 [Homo sapiens]